MNEVTLSPQVEKALADLRQAIIDQLAAGTTSAVPAPEISAVTPAETADISSAAPAIASVAPVDTPVSPAVEPVVPPAEIPVAPAAAQTPSEVSLPDLGSSPNNITDLSGLPPITPPPVSANNGLDDSAPILPTMPAGDQAAAPVDLSAAASVDLNAPVTPAPELNPIAPVSEAAPIPAPEVTPAAPVMPDLNASPIEAPVETPVEAPVAAPVETTPITPPTPPADPATTGLPKANSLLSNVLKKGWNSNQ